MVYDKADWHYGGEFPAHLPFENGGTHIGMFLAWIIKNNLEGELHIKHSGEELDKVRSENITGRDFFFKVCDAKFWSDDINQEGNLFTKHYYESNLYISDYDEVLGTGLETLYHVEDTWDNFRKLESRIQKAYEQWKEPKRWWKFW